MNDAVNKVNAFLKTLNTKKQYDRIDGDEHTFKPSAKTKRLHPEEIEANKRVNNEYTPIENLYQDNA